MSAATALTILLVSANASGGERAALRGYAELLEAHVARGRVDYRSIAGPDRAKLDGYLEFVAKASLPEGRAARTAFYIDAYNALVLRSVLETDRPRSVLDVKGFFSSRRHVVAGTSMTLNDLEKRRLIPFARDPRVHFALVCGAVGCPILDPRPYRGSDLDARLTEATRRYLASPFGARVSGDRLLISKIFDWYAPDFGGAAAVPAFLEGHLPASKRLADLERSRIAFIDYNWTLNQQ